MAIKSTLETEILRRSHDVGYQSVSEAIGHDASHISRILSNQYGLKLCELERFLSALGFAIIQCDGEVVSLPKVELDALKTLARKELDRGR